MPAQVAVEHLVDERGLPGARYPRHAHEQAEGDRDRDVPEVVLTRTPHEEAPGGVGLPTPRVATDDWPFLYLRTGFVADYYLVALAIILIGAFIFGMANKGIVYAQWNPDWFKFFLGLMLLLATIVNLIVKRRAELK